MHAYCTYTNTLSSSLTTIRHRKYEIRNNRSDYEIPNYGGGDCVLSVPNQFLKSLGYYMVESRSLNGPLYGT